MLKKVIKYEDFDGKEREETFYFNLTTAELAEWELSISGGMTGWIERIVETETTPEMVKLFKELITKSYGEKSPDGKRFIKNEELTEAFIQSNAYSVLFMELITDAKNAADFANGVMPKELNVDPSKIKLNPKNE